MNHFHRCERPEIFRSVFDDPARNENPWKAFVLDANPGIGFIVLQTHIVSGLMLFNQAVFKEQRIQLRIHNNRFYVCDFSHENSCFPVFMTFLLKIGTHSLFERFRLTHIEQEPILVIELVHTRPVFQG